MRIAFFGSGEFGIPTYRSLKGDGHEIVLVVSQPPRPAGRGREVQPTPLAAHAMGDGARVLTPADVNAPEVLAALREARADLAYVVAFGQKVGAAVRESFPVGIVNLHGSLLPAYRGAAPVQWAVIRGEPRTGVTVFRLVEEMDAGPILAQRETAIGEDETADELHDRLARIGCDCVRAALERLARRPDDAGDPQDASRATRARKLTKADGVVDFARPAEVVARRVNGLWSWPGAGCRFRSADGTRDEAVVLARARFDPAGRHAGAAIPGTIGETLTVATGRGAIELLEIKPAGGRVMDWQSFVNGRHVRPGDRFIGAEGGPRD